MYYNKSYVNDVPLPLRPSPLSHTYLLTERTTK